MIAYNHHIKQWCFEVAAGRCVQCMARLRTCNTMDEARRNARSARYYVRKNGLPLKVEKFGSCVLLRRIEEKE